MPSSTRGVLKKSKGPLLLVSDSVFFSTLPHRIT
jgi:hypothetical protein